jgi:hypothetical protein
MPTAQGDECRRGQPSGSAEMEAICDELLERRLVKFGNPQMEGKIFACKKSSGDNLCGPGLNVVSLVGWSCFCFVDTMVLYNQSFCECGKIMIVPWSSFKPVEACGATVSIFLSKTFPEPVNGARKKHTLRAPVMELSPRVSLTHQVHVTYETRSTRQKDQREQWET